MNTSTQAAGSNGVERRPALHGAAEFVSWTWEMINAGAECGWSPDGTEIVVSNPEKLQADVIPVYFRHGQVPVGPCPSTNPNPNPNRVPNVGPCAQRVYNYISQHLPASPYFTLQLHTSPYISLHLAISRAVLVVGPRAQRVQLQEDQAGRVAPPALPARQAGSAQARHAAATQEA